MAYLLIHLFMIGLAECTVGIYHSAISAFLEPHCDAISLKCNNTDVVYNYALLSAYIQVCI